MDKKGAKGYWISTAKIINQDLFDEYVNKVGPWLKEVGPSLCKRYRASREGEDRGCQFSSYLRIPINEGSS